jgi:hypothetical protein
VATWAALTSIDDPRDGDRVGVTDVDGSGSVGVAQYVSGSSEWRLVSVTTTTHTRLTSITRPIVTGAIAGVGSGTAQSLMRYVYDGSAWVRVASGRAVVWASSTLGDIANTDPSGIGITLPGDALLLTLANGVVSLRLVRFTTAGGSFANADVWVPSDWLSSGTVALRSRLVGTEASRGSAGLTDFITGTGPTITGASNVIWTRMQCPNVVSAIAGVQVTGLTLGSGEQAYTRCITRAQGSGTTAGSASTAGLFTGDGSRGSIARQIGTGALRFDNGSGVALNGSTVRGNGGTALPTSGDGDLLEKIDEGRTLMTLMRRNGGPYHMALRDQAATSSTFVGALCTSTNAAPGTAWMDIREMVVITRTP